VRCQVTVLRGKIHASSMIGCEGHTQTDRQTDRQTERHTHLHTQVVIKFYANSNAPNRLRSCIELKKLYRPSADTLCGCSPDLWSLELKIGMAVNPTFRNIYTLFLSFIVFELGHLDRQTDTRADPRTDSQSSQFSTTKLDG